MSETKLKVYIADNFAIHSYDELPTSSAYLQRSDVYLDERLGILTENWDRKDFQWYYNYLDSAKFLSTKNKDAYCNYLLDIGYIPLVYMPTVCKEFSVKLLNLLDKMNIEYVRMRPTSFVYSRVNIETPDAWISKMTVSKLLNIPIEQVTSKETFRRIFQ